MKHVQTSDRTYSNEKILGFFTDFSTNKHYVGKYKLFCRQAKPEDHNFSHVLFSALNMKHFLHINSAIKLNFFFIGVWKKNTALYMVPLSLLSLSFYQSEKKMLSKK
jgi:hypothetical protein